MAHAVVEEISALLDLGEERLQEILADPDARAAFGEFVDVEELDDDEEDETRGL